jgi:hypothetical protein
MSNIPEIASYREEEEGEEISTTRLAKMDKISDISA